MHKLNYKDKTGEILMRKNKWELSAAPGSLVEVNGHLLHIYAEGNGGKKFIFMSGSGTPAPVLDFKPLWSLLVIEIYLMRSDVK
jgi:hypothetical protein